MGNESIIKWISTTQNEVWSEKKAPKIQESADTLELTGEKDQVIEGFGGCFNELGWIALSHLDETEQNKVFDELFLPDGGCRFNFCRMPVGANDYSAEWYSYNETPDDYEMKNFSISRDKNYLIPYIKMAMERRRDIKLFASPWSPPTWMKFPRAYNHGTMVWEKEILEAYSLYFVRFVKAYAEEGIKIDQIHVQNEPMSDQKFPSCVWKGEEFKEFISDYLGPRFEREGLDTEIWLGTLNGPEVDHRFLHTGYDQYANLVLTDSAARKYVKGVSYQWAGKYAVQQTHDSWPEIRLMQSENECGDGRNTWEYAHYIFNLFRHYLYNGVSSYIYWNMILEPEGKSTWGWKQNSMITINPETREVTYNPEFYVMKHFSHFIQPGAVRLKTKGRWTGNAVVFENPNGELVLVVGNNMAKSRRLTFMGFGKQVIVEIPPYSFNTIVVK